MRGRALVVFVVLAATVVACGMGEPGGDSGDPGRTSVSTLATTGGTASEGRGSGPGTPAPGDAGVPGHVVPSDIDAHRELVITALDVIEDRERTAPGGPWSFDWLIRNMAGRNDPSELVMRWLATWRTRQQINGYFVPARPPIDSQLIGPWRVRSGCSPLDESCKLDLTRSPFRLGAIVYRPDLRSIPDLKAGEARFVFGVADARGQAMPFTIIFEYLLPAPRGAVDILTWADEFHRLGRHRPGRAFNQALEKITERFAGANAAPDRPNGSALGQLRTNELALQPLDPTNPGATKKVWELREFQLGSDGWIHPATVKQNPDLSLNGTRELADFLLRNQGPIRAGTHQVPEAMLGGFAPVPDGVEWSVPGAGVPEDVRHLFGLATCSGCHRWENQNSNSGTVTFFTHIAARDAGTPAGTSRFLQSELSGVRATDFAALLSMTPAELLSKEGHAPRKARVH